MAAIVKANSSLTAGGLAVLKRTFSTEREGRLNYVAEYVCLAAFARNHASKFRTGAVPPTPIPALVGQLQIRDNPTLYDLQTETVNGLTYFRATYSASGDGEASFSVTESSEQRSFQASQTKQVATGSPGFVIINEATDFLSFDYISISVSASSNNRRISSFGSSIFLAGETATSRSTTLSRRGSVGQPFNIRKGRSYSGGSTFPNEGRVQFRSTTIETASSTRNSDGTTTYSATSSGIYVEGGLGGTLV